MPAWDVIDLWQVHTGPVGDGRAAMRSVLSRYLGSEPVFVREPLGKPTLPGRRLEFSYSRSGDVALLAVSRGRPVGVDVERLKPGRPVERIARRMFAADEALALASLDPDEQPAAFHRCWTGKEAYVKGLGTGLAHGLASFSVAGLVAGRKRCPVAGWEVEQLAVPAGYAAAVAAPGPEWEIALHTLESAGD